MGRAGQVYICMSTLCTEQDKCTSSVRGVYHEYILFWTCMGPLCEV
jgi:hypothetical protein